MTEPSREPKGKTEMAFESSLWPTPKEEYRHARACFGFPFSNMMMLIHTLTSLFRNETYKGKWDF